VREGYLRGLLRGRLPPEELGRLPAGFQRVGHVALLRLPPELWERRREIGEALVGRNGIRTVAVLRGVEGRERRPEAEVVAGDPKRSPCTGSTAASSGWTPSGSCSPPGTCTRGGGSRGW